MSTLIADVQASLSRARQEWGWFLAVGIALILLGAAAIVYQPVSTLASVLTLGTIVVAAGILQLFLAMRARGAGHVILTLLIGLLDIVVGFALIEHPAAGALFVTLMLAVYLVFGGLMRVVYALWAQLPHYGWAALSGLAAAVLGAMLWAEWPVSAVWFIGFAVGLNFVFLGAELTAFAFKLRSI